jgi:hypothetical protein
MVLPTSAETVCQGVKEALQELERVAPGVPLLALGQTIFWDEPMKAGIAQSLTRLGLDRKFVAGVHDTDYFAKLPTGKRQPGQFRALAHNDTTTKGLWSAAAEFSALFGSETMVTRESLIHAGLGVSRLEGLLPGFLDEATEAWGWRGLVSLSDQAPITRDVTLRQVFPELQGTLHWAIDLSLDSLVGEGRRAAAEQAERLKDAFCTAGEDRTQSIADFYKRLLPTVYEFVSGSRINLESTATTELLQFNIETASKPRFELLNLFATSSMRSDACDAYNEAIKGGSGQYELSRFGSGAIPFDLIIPGVGRGTIRIGNRAIVIMTPKPQFITMRKPLSSVQDLAEAIETKFGANCTLVGKAVTLIGMLGREFVFVFHEGASSYVKHSRRFHQILQDKGLSVQANPILRVRYDAWSALDVACTWLKLPEPFRRPFGTEELCAPSFAQRWKKVAVEQDEILSQLGKLRSPIDLIRYLERTIGGSWRTLADEYEALQDSLQTLRQKVEDVRLERQACYNHLRLARQNRVEAEVALGNHFRSEIFDRSPSPEAVAERRELQAKVTSAIHELREAQHQSKALLRKQFAVAKDPESMKILDRRRSIEIEAELRRLRLIQQAVTTSKGLSSANLRPSAWWFPLVSPDGLWFRETVNSAKCYLEPLL